MAFLSHYHLLVSQIVYKLSEQWAYLDDELIVTEKAMTPEVESIFNELYRKLCSVKILIVNEIKDSEKKVNGLKTLESMHHLQKELLGIIHNNENS